jgi:hypothetical protein
MATASSEKSASDTDLDLEWLLKVRTAVARVGEMDLARWWNSTGQLGPQGASVLRRGFTKRLERGRFLWPSLADGVVTISVAQLSYLLSGIDWRMPQATWRPQASG